MNFISLFNQYIAEHGSTIFYAIMTGIVGTIGSQIKNIFKEYTEEKTKKSIAKTVVKAVEQIYHNDTSNSKYDKALENIQAMFNEKCIVATDLELRLLLESVVAELNYDFID